jgi:hypothetical protein
MMHAKRQHGHWTIASNFGVGLMACGEARCVPRCSPGRSARRRAMTGGVTPLRRLTSAILTRGQRRARAVSPHPETVSQRPAQTSHRKDFRRFAAYRSVSSLAACAAKRLPRAR